MAPIKTPSNKKHSYSGFVLAVVLYVLGVVTFSAWSYFEHRTEPGSAHLQEPSAQQNRRTALAEGARAVFLLAMVVPLIALYTRARVHSHRKEQQLNEKLQNDYQSLKQHGEELGDAMRDLERFNALATGREERILELKAEVNELLRELDRPKRYDSPPGKPN